MHDELRQKLRENSDELIEEHGREAVIAAIRHAEEAEAWVVADALMEMGDPHGI